MAEMPWFLNIGRKQPPAELPATLPNQVKPPVTSVKDTLSATESSNDPDAWRRNKDGREFVGQWQFGEARLRDLGLGAKFTMEQFRRDPELQSRVMDDHIADINSFIDKHGLNAYEGTTVGGVPITRSGMIAMAHLGGSRGMQRFLESDGEYNPADELGTSLSDYATKHGGPTIANSPEGRENRLRTFSTNADSRASELRSMAQEVTNLGFDAKMNPQANANAGAMMALAQIDPRFRALDGVMPPATQLGFGSAVPEGADPFTAQGMPKPIRMGAGQLSFGGGQAVETPTGAPPGFAINPQDTAGMSAGEAVTRGAPPAGVSEEAAPEELERNGFLTRVGQAIFGEDEEDPDGRLKTLIGGIGVGLGQMSAGMPVDLQPYFANVAAQKQAVIEADQAARQQAIENELSYMNADTQRMNAETAYLKYQNEVAQAAKEGRPLDIGFSPETIAKYGDQERFRPFVEMMNSSDEAVQKEGLAGFRSALLDDAKNMSANPDAVANVYDALNSRDPELISKALRENPLGVEDFKRLADITDPGVAMRNALALADANADPEVVDMFKSLARMQGGISDNQIQRDNYAAGREYYGNLLRSVSEGRDLNFNVSLLREKAIKAAREGRKVEGFQEPYLANLLAVSSQGLPADWQARLEQEVGLDPGEYQQMNSLSKFIALQAARPLMEGQGAVTDSERRDLALSVSDPTLTFEAQVALLDKLQVLADLDTAAAQYYRRSQSDELHGNFQELQGDIEFELAPAIPALYRSREAWTALKNLDTSDQYRTQFMDEAGNMLPAPVVYGMLAPKLTRKQYSMLRSTGEDGLDNLVFEDIWMDVSTGQLMRGFEPFNPTSVSPN